MVDFALDAERNEGKSPREAIHQACLLRFRPILMTTMAALFAALPLMLGSGTGSELRHPLGVTIVGGLIVSQVADVVHDAGHLSRLRSAGPRGAPAVRPTCSTPRTARSEPVDPVHRAAGRDHAADDRRRARRASSPISSCRWRRCRRSISRRSRCTATMPGASPETMATTVATPLERHLGVIADVTEMTSSSTVGNDPDHAAIRPQPQHRRRRARRAGGDQRGARRPADEPAAATRPTARSIRPTRRSRSCR